MNQTAREDPLISVIIPVCNGEKWLDTCLKSVCAQTHRNLEIILIDDGSTDASGRQCDAWQKRDSRIVVLHQENRGPAAARNAGLDTSHGDWVAFVDCDDQIEPDMYEYLLGLARKYRAQIAQCAIQSLGGHGNRTKWAYVPEEKLLRGFLPNLAPQDFDLISYSLCNKLYCWRWLGDRRLSEELKIGEDLAFNLGLLTEDCRLAVGGEGKYWYRTYETSFSHRTPDLDHLTGTHRALDMVQEKLQAQKKFSTLVFDEKLRDCLDVCSKLVCAGVPEWSWLEKEMRREIGEQYGYILGSKRFSLFEKGKFTLIRFFWPVYRRVIPARRKMKMIGAGKAGRDGGNETDGPCP